MQDGKASVAKLGFVKYLTMDAHNNIYMSDQYNVTASVANATATMSIVRVLSIDIMTITTLAGSCKFN